MSGNPVEFGDGCATVTGYELHQATASSGKAGARFEAPSQDIGWSVLILAASGEVGPLLRKEKDEASLLTLLPFATAWQDFTF